MTVLHRAYSFMVKRLKRLFYSFLLLLPSKNTRPTFFRGVGFIFRADLFSFASSAENTFGANRVTFSVSRKITFRTSHLVGKSPFGQVTFPTSRDKCGLVATSRKRRRSRRLPGPSGHSGRVLGPSRRSVKPPSATKIS